MKRTLFFAISLLWLSALLVSGAARAQNLVGKKTITLSDAIGGGGNETIVIGTVTFTPAPEGKTQFKVELDSAKFGEYFLAMRPFKCVTGPRQHLCHFPLERVGDTITSSDFQPLEYALMFMHKKPATVSLDSRNGLFYALTRTPAGFSGRVSDVDMEPIIVPDSVPAAQRERPIRKQDLHTSDPSAYWLPFITIE
jgi:hypothetical protein